MASGARRRPRLPTPCIAPVRVMRRCCRRWRASPSIARRASSSAPARSNSWSSSRSARRARRAPTRRARRRLPRARLPRRGRRVTAPVKLSVAQVNALIGAGSDPEPTVRAHAVTAMLASGDRARVLTPIVARLVDPARVVRARAAEALLSLAVATLPGAAGVALAARAGRAGGGAPGFPDAPANHAALGWLESERGRIDAANAALDRASRSTRVPHVLRRPGRDRRTRRKV